MQKTVRESRQFGNDVLSLKMNVEQWPKVSNRKEIWESLRGSAEEGAVRVEVFFHLNKIEHVSVSERRDGKLFKSEFNSLLEAVAGDSKMAGEHGKKLEEFLKDEGKKEFFKHMMDSDGITSRVQGTERYVHLVLNKKIVSELRLEWKMSCKWMQEGDSLVLTPLKETSIPTSIRFSPTSSAFTVVLAEEMSFVQKLKVGDYVKWKKEGENLLSLKKVSLDDTSIITRISGNEYQGVVYLPKIIATALKLEEKPSCKWEQEGKAWIIIPLEKTTLQSKVLGEASSLQVTLPEGVQLACGLKLGDCAEWSREGKRTHLTMHVLVPLEIRRLGFRDIQVEWIKRGEEITIKPADNLYISSVTETILGGKWSRFHVCIPEGLPEAKNVRVGMEVRFRIDERGRVVITPKQA